MGLNMHVERKLAAILAADVVGYSRLMAVDEVGTLRALPVETNGFGKSASAIGLKVLMDDAAPHDWLDGASTSYASDVQGPKRPKSTLEPSSVSR